MDDNMSDFCKNVTELASLLGTRKDHVLRFIKKHFAINKDYIVKYEENITRKKWGGNNEQIILLKECVYDLVKNTYNKRNRYFTSSTTINPCILSIENATVGFIQEAFKGIIEMERQHTVGKYKIDLYIPSYKIAVECDEDGHIFYGKNKEIQRQKYIEDKLGCMFLRFNPSDTDFTLVSFLNRLNNELWRRRIV